MRSDVFVDIRDIVWYNELTSKVLYITVGGSPEREVIAMVTFDNLIQFVMMITGVISLVYVITKDHNKK